MRVLIAPDSFTGTLSAVAAAEAIGRGWSAGAGHDVLRVIPLSDGGPGLSTVIAASGEVRVVPVSVTDPLGRPRAGSFLIRGDTAWVESALACGLHLLAPGERDPGDTSSAGLGTLLLAAAASSGVKRVVVGLGGSGTNDGGAGMLATLGCASLDSGADPLPPGGLALARIASLSGAPAAFDVEVVAATDVDNPLLGIDGASAIYGPQKGADADLVQRLDAALTAWAAVLQTVPGAPDDVAAAPGAGAAGGIGAALLALGARRESGVALVADEVRLADVMDEAELVITGEGSFDAQSLRGKVVHGVAAMARDRGLPCLVLAGRVSVGRREQAASGVDAAYSLIDHPGSNAAGSAKRAAADASAQLAALARRVAGEWSRPLGR